MDNTLILIIYSIKQKTIRKSGFFICVIENKFFYITLIYQGRKIIWKKITMAITQMV